jgi:hypothetical protein
MERERERKKEKERERVSEREKEREREIERKRGIERERERERGRDRVGITRSRVSRANVVRSVESWNICKIDNWPPLEFSSLADTFLLLFADGFKEHNLI